MRLHVLDRKLGRDLRRLWAQALAIALVLGCGVALQLTATGMVRALQATREDYYDAQAFADLFAQARRAPLAVLDEVRAIDGVLAAEARVAGLVTLDLPGREAPAAATVLSLPPEGPRLNVPLLVEGRLPDPESDREVAVSARFAQAHGFRPGDGFAAVAGGRRLDLVIAGTVRSPEFVYALPPGGMMPDDAGYGIVWMPERAAAATFDLGGAFNDLALALRRDADPVAVAERVDALLAPWGGTGAHGRDRQLSHAFIDAEILQLRSMALILPPVVFAVAAFLVNMVLGRIVALEREEIGLLKALGYRDAEVALHYLLLAGVVAAGGILAGWAVGTWLGRGMAGLYARFYDFPWLIRTGGLDVYALSGLVGLAASGLGAARAALAAARLAPAVAMAPPAPPRFRHGPLDRLAARLRLSQPGLMVLRGIVRWPLRSGLTALGLGFGVATLVASGFMTDALEVVVDRAFYQANRQHAILGLAQEAPLSVADDARRLPGVLAVEPQHDLPATLRHGPRAKEAAITARAPGGDLVRTLDAAGRVVEPPDSGLLLSRELARQLDAGPGDLVEVEVTGRPGEAFAVPVTAVTEQVVGLGAVMALDDLSARLREAPRATALNLALDPAELPAFRAALKGLPGVAATVMLTEVRDSFRRTIAENVGRTTAVFLTIAVLITAGVAYNGARIQLSERSRELASLRILGFTRAEVSSILLGETALLALLAQPLGWALGAGVAWLMVHGFESDLYRIPLVLTPATLARSSLVALAATAAAALVVRRRIDRLDLVAVLKTRE